MPEGCKWVELPSFEDERGALFFWEQSDALPFDVKRVFWITCVPEGQTRGGHAHKTCAEVIFPVHGSFDIYVDDSKNSLTLHLSSPQRGILIPADVWCKLENFDKDAVCLVLASQVYDAEGYINDYHSYLAYRQCR